MNHPLESKSATTAADMPATGLANITSISVGAGAVLVFFPSLALYFGNGMLGKDQPIGLSTVAIFGILILLGALALVSTMFAKMGLANREEALALPPGSIRAAIAMALIVLFALLSVMLYNSLTRCTQTIEHLSAAEKKELVSDRTNHVTSVVPVPCPPSAADAATTSAVSTSGAVSAASSVAARANAASSVASGASASSGGAAAARVPACTNGEAFSYTVTLAMVPGSPAVDFAKQLLTLIGTLMTSVVSFYFAARSADATMRTAIKAVTQPTEPESPTKAPPAKGDGEADHDHGNIKNATDDKDLPVAKGGVAS